MRTKSVSNTFHSCVCQTIRRGTVFAQFYAFRPDNVPLVSANNPAVHYEEVELFW